MKECDGLTPMNETASKFAETLLNLCHGDKELAKIECFNSARSYDRQFSTLPNKYWVDCYQAILDA